MLARALSMVFSVLLLAGSVEAQVVRTWVSATGIDNVACDRENPCRTFGAAILAVVAGGEVVVLDSAGYGPVTIDKAVSIISPPGIFAAIAPTAGSAISIAPAVTNSTIVLRGLTLNGRGGATGIRHGDAADISGNRLFVEDCWISGFTFRGIQLTRAGSFFIRNTVIRECNPGILFAALPASSIGVLDQVHLERNNNGLIVNAGRVAVRNSVAANNSGDGFRVGEAAGFAGSAPVLNVEASQSTHNASGASVSIGGKLAIFGSVLSFNQFGIVSEAGSEGRIGGNQITGNQTSISNSGIVLTRGDNTLQLNVSDAVVGTALAPYTTE